MITHNNFGKLIFSFILLLQYIHILFTHAWIGQLTLLAKLPSITLKIKLDSWVTIQS
jgi:hypothetical protein